MKIARYFIVVFIFNMYAIFLKLLRSDFWVPSSKLKQIDVGALRIFLQNCYDSSTYWRKKFKSHGVIINSPSLIDEIRKLPPITKSEVLKNYDIIKSDRYNFFSKSTSGTSGQSLSMSTSIKAEAYQWFVWRRYWKNLGIRSDEWMCWLGGRKILSDSNSIKPWINVYPLKRMMVSSQHLDEEAAIKIWAELVRRNIRWIHGYPSSVSYFVELLIRNGETNKLVNPIVTVGGESLLNTQRNLIEKYFGSRVFQHYGITEGTHSFCENKDGRFGFDDDFCINLIHDDKVLGTNYRNNKFPLINYDSGDIFRLKDDQVIDIEGRVDDYVIGKNGIRFNRLDHLFKKVKGLIKAQIVQEEPGELTIYTIIENCYEEKQLIISCNNYFGDNMNYKIKICDTVPILEGGKFKQVVRL